MLRALRKERRLGIARAREVEIDEAAIGLLEAVFDEAGITLRRTR
jgi:hypothetical protein